MYQVWEWSVYIGQGTTISNFCILKNLQICDEDVSGDSLFNVVVSVHWTGMLYWTTGLHNVFYSVMCHRDSYSFVALTLATLLWTEATVQ